MVQGGLPDPDLHSPNISSGAMTNEEVSVGETGDATVPQIVATPSPPDTEDMPHLEDVPSARGPPSDPEVGIPSILEPGPSDTEVRNAGEEEMIGIIDSSEPIPLPAPASVSREQLSASSEILEELTEEDTLRYLEKMDSLRAHMSDTTFRAGTPFPICDGSELDQVLNFTIRMAQKGLDTDVAQIERMYQEDLAAIFSRIYSDESTAGWLGEPQQKSIYRRTEQALQLIAMKFGDDYTRMTDLLTIFLNPSSRFMSTTGSKLSEKFPTVILPPSRVGFPQLFTTASSSSDGARTADPKFEEDVIPPNIYARSFDSRSPKGYLVDYLNVFGQAGGFHALKQRIVNADESKPLTILLLVSWLKPFGQCYDYLAKRTVERYFQDIFVVVPRFLESMSDEEFKKESGKQDGKTDPVSTILRSLRSLAKVLPEQSSTVNQLLETTRLSAIFKLLKVSTYNGKMHALNEINRIIQSFSYTHRSFAEEDSSLGADKVAAWIQDSHVLTVILADSLHQPQYVEKLEKIIRFMIKEKSLSVSDLDELWNAQSGKHEAIVKNVHDLLTKLAWDFSPEQLDHLFGHFQESWVSAPRRQREKLLDLIRRLAEDDKEGVMAVKVLDLLWHLCHNEELPTEIMEQALAAHLKILDYTCSHDREHLKMTWLKKCVEEIRRNSWAVPALRHIRQICEQFPEVSTSVPPIGNGRTYLTNRREILNILVKDHHIMQDVISSLEQYLDQVRAVIAQENIQSFDPVTQDLLGSKYPHAVHVESRLDFLQYVLQHGQTTLNDPETLWSCLAEHPTSELDRDLCFKWFNKAMEPEYPDINQDVIKDFYERKILQFDPSCLTEAGIKCFRSFLRFVNTKEDKLELRRKNYFLNQYELLGMDYLWKIVLTCREETAQQGIDLMRDIYTSPSQKLQGQIINLHMDVISECMERLRPIYDNLESLKNDKDYRNEIVQNTNKAVRILKVLTEYIVQYDKDHPAERVKLPLGRASMGRGFLVLVKSPHVSRQLDEYEVYMHTNETVGGLRREICRRSRLSPNSSKLDLHYNNELLRTQDDRRLLIEVLQEPLRERPVVTVKYAPSPYASNLADTTGTVSSPESSNDVSPIDTPQDGLDETTWETEKLLPGVWIARGADSLEQKDPISAIQFIIRFADLGSRLDNRRLLETARELLSILPAEESILKSIHNAVEDHSIPLDSIFRVDSPSQVLYSLQVLQSVILPAKAHQYDTASHFTASLFAKRHFVEYLLETLTRNNFLQGTDSLTKQQSYQCILRLVKLALFVILRAGCMDDAVLMQRLQHGLNPGARRGFPDETLHMIRILFSQNKHGWTATLPDHGLFMAANRVVMLWKEGPVPLPTIDVCRALRHVAWTAASGSLHLLGCPEDDARGALEKKVDPVDLVDASITEEALECLILSIILTPKAIEYILQQNGSQWMAFFQDMVIVCRSPSIRQAAHLWFRTLASSFSTDRLPLDAHMIKHFFAALLQESKIRPDTCGDAFGLVSKLITGFGHFNQRPLPEADRMLTVELKWLAEARRSFAEYGRQHIHEVLLEGHLLVLSSIIRTLSPQVKHYIRTAHSQVPLLREIIEDFLFPAAKVLLKAAQAKAPPQSGTPGDAPVVSSSTSSSELFDAAYSESVALLDSPNQARAICQSSLAMSAAFEVIITLCVGCVENLTTLNEILTILFYSEKETPITEWEYSPPVGPRKLDGFVGLKNAGATCYMNSVLQQFYMIPSVRNNLLSVEGIAASYDEEQPEEKGEGDAPRNEFVGPLLPFTGPDEPEAVPDFTTPLIPTKAPVVQDYNLGLIKQLQIIFSNLACSKLQFYIPKGFWKHFRLGNEPVNLREQHDALEFYNSIVDGVDEGLKALKKAPVMGRMLGGTFADQKICKDCPHRYSREEAFTTLNVDIRNFHTLQDALELYVKGDLLEGANAYFCEKCQRKVDAVKRMCIKRLPPILTIQLKRFDYDWEREQPLKFNDYFEFPRVIDMEPYTAAGLAKVEGQTVPDDEEELAQVFQETSGGAIAPKSELQTVTKYRLVGIVVHSGQASGGHYYSYILDRDGDSKWYRFDDGDVTECKMDDDEEMKTQCFGGEPPRQKRWWNAYILFYERFDLAGPSVFGTAHRERFGQRARLVSESIGAQVVHMIPSTLRSRIVKENLKFLHNRSQFVPEYFAFMKRLLMQTSQLMNFHHDNGQRLMNFKSVLSQDEADACGLMVIQLLGKFLFEVCWRSRRNLRGPAQEWADLTARILQVSPICRHYFVEHVLLKNPRRIFEYGVESPSGDVRSALFRVIGQVALFGAEDACLPSTIDAAQRCRYVIALQPDSLGDLLIVCCLCLVQLKETSDHVRQLGNLITFFIQYAAAGPHSRYTLAKLGVADVFAKVILEEIGLFKYSYHTGNELTKIYQLVSSVIRSLDFSDTRIYSSDIDSCEPMYQASSPNPFQFTDQPGVQMLEMCPLPSEMCTSICLTDAFVRKLLDDAIGLEDVRSLLKFLAWESPSMTLRIIKATMNALSAQFIAEARVLLEFAFSFIQVSDSVVLHRLDWFFIGSEQEGIEGFVQLLNGFRHNNQRRAYLFFKHLILFLDRSPEFGHKFYVSMMSVHNNECQSFAPVKTVCIETYEWLLALFEQPQNSRPYFSGGNYYNTMGWNNQVISNDTGTGLNFERSNSAKNILEKAGDLFQEEAWMLQQTHGNPSPGEEEDSEEPLAFNASGNSNMSGMDPSSSTINTETEYPQTDDDQWGPNPMSVPPAVDVVDVEPSGPYSVLTPRKPGTSASYGTLGTALDTPDKDNFLPGRRNGVSVERLTEGFADMDLDRTIGPVKSRSGMDEYNYNTEEELMSIQPLHSLLDDEPSAVNENVRTTSPADESAPPFRGITLGATFNFDQSKKGFGDGRFSSH